MVVVLVVCRVFAGGCSWQLLHSFHIGSRGCWASTARRSRDGRMTPGIMTPGLQPALCAAGCCPTALPVLCAAGGSVYMGMGSRCRQPVFGGGISGLPAAGAGPGPGRANHHQHRGGPQRHSRAPLEHRLTATLGGVHSRPQPGAAGERPITQP